MTTEMKLLVYSEELYRLAKLYVVEIAVLIGPDLYNLKLVEVVVVAVPIEVVKFVAVILKIVETE